MENLTTRVAGGAIRAGLPLRVAGKVGRAGLLLRAAGKATMAAAKAGMGAGGAACCRAGPIPVARAGPGGRRRLPLAKDAGRGWQGGRPVVDSWIRRQTRRLRPLAGGGGALLHRGLFPRSVKAALDRAARAVAAWARRAARGRGRRGRLGWLAVCLTARPAEVA